MQNLLCPPSLKVYNEYLCFLYNPLFSFRLIHLTLFLSLSLSFLPTTFPRIMTIVAWVSHVITLKLNNVARRRRRHSTFDLFDERISIQ